MVQKLPPAAVVRAAAQRGYPGRNGAAKTDGVRWNLMKSAMYPPDGVGPAVDRVQAWTPGDAAEQIQRDVDVGTPSRKARSGQLPPPHLRQARGDAT
jgi:hypothetical protein